MSKKARPPGDYEPQVGLGSALLGVRKRKGVSQKKLAERTGISAGWISRIEDGQTNPTWGHVRKLAKALGVKVSFLATEAERLEPRPWRW